VDPDLLAIGDDAAVLLAVERVEQMD